MADDARSGQTPGRDEIPTWLFEDDTLREPEDRAPRAHRLPGQRPSSANVRSATAGQATPSEADSSTGASSRPVTAKTSASDETRAVPTAHRASDDDATASTPTQKRAARGHERPVKASVNTARKAQPAPTVRAGQGLAQGTTASARPAKSSEGRRSAAQAAGVTGSSAAVATTEIPLTSNRAWGHEPSKGQRLIGLDGLRALAVLTVMAFHFQVPGFSGGFLGVDMFFVLSGYLITSQLWTRWRPGHVAFGKFWGARVRRLAPAVLLLIAATILAMGIWHPQGLAQQLKDSLAAVTYTSNWWYIFGGRPYGDFGNWWFLEHLWSLAIEEQFYVFWPLVVAAVLYLVKDQTKRRKVMMGIAIGGAIISTLFMTYYAFNYGGEGNIDPSRQYFGTDSHAMGLLTGAALAFFFDGAGFKGGARELPRASSRLTIVGSVAVLASLATMLTVEFSDLWLYRYGGFLIFSIIVAVAVAAAAHPGPLANALGNKVFKYVGDRSYGLYLWHWPLVVVPWVGDKMRDGWLIPAICLTIATFVLAELSYRFIEMPVRSKGFRGAIFGTKADDAAAGAATTSAADGSAAATKRRAPVAAILAGGLVLGGAFTAYRALAPQPCDAGCQQQKQVAATMEKLKKQDEARKKAAAKKGTAAAAPTVKPTGTAVAGLDKKSTKDMTISVWGDSVVDAIANDQLPHAFKAVSNNAVVAMQSWTVFDKIKAADKAGQITQDVVLIHVGDNGFVQESQLQDVLDQLKKKHTVVIVTPKTTIPEGNQARQAILNVADKNKDVKLLDWYTASNGHPEYFVDGVHLKSVAEPVYIDLLQKALKQK